MRTTELLYSVFPLFCEEQNTSVCTITKYKLCNFNDSTYELNLHFHLKLALHDKKMNEKSMLVI